MRSAFTSKRSRPSPGRTQQSRPAGALAALCARHRQPVTVAGIQFPGLVGLAAGMDKDGIGIKTWGSLGFGFVELGTVDGSGPARQ